MVGVEAMADDSCCGVYSARRILTWFHVPTAGSGGLEALDAKTANLAARALLFCFTSDSRGRPET